MHTEHYRRIRKDAVKRLEDILDGHVADDCHGIQTALATILKHGSHKEAAKALMSAFEWKWAVLESEEEGEVHHD